MVTPMMNLMVQRYQSAYEEAFKSWRRLLNVPRVCDRAHAKLVHQAPSEVVYEEAQLRLLHYTRATPPAFAEPLLICYALVNRPYILDLQPARSVVRRFLELGFDVYLIDWGIATAADRSQTLSHYVQGLMKNVSDFLIEHTASPQYNLLGYCMGGTMSTMFTATYPSVVKNLGLMATPIDFASRDSLLQVWTDPAHFDVDALIDTFGNCPAPFLQYSFQMMRPVQNYYTKYSGFYEKMYDPDFVDNFFAMEQWTNDNIPVAGETFREFVKKLYQRNELVRGEFRFRLNGPAVDLEQITCPLLLLVATGDHLVPPSQTIGILPHVGSSETRSMEIDAGHVGLAVGSKAHRQFWPRATGWFADHSTLKT